MKPSLKNYLHFFFLIIIILLAYYNSLPNEFFGSDDIRGILHNPDIDNINAIFNPPILFFQKLTRFFVVKIAGTNPAAFRSVNIIFHIGTAVSVYILILLLTKKDLLALFTSAFFAVHPILSEPVGWISAASYPQSSFFIIVALITYSLSKKRFGLFQEKRKPRLLAVDEAYMDSSPTFPSANRAKQRTTGSTRRSLYLLSIVFFILSLLASEKAIIFPLIIFLYDYCYTKEKFSPKRLLPFITIAALFLYFLYPLIRVHVEYFENGGTINSIIRNPLTHIPLVIGTYIMLIFYPRNLYPHFKTSFTHNEYLINLVICILLSILIIYSFKKIKHVFFWLIFFLISLIPTTLPLGINTNFAERYVYLGSIGIFFTLSYALFKLTEKIKDKSVGYTIFVILISIFILITHQDNKDLRNSISFKEARVREFPNDYLAHFDLGEAYAEANDPRSAKLEHFEAVKLNPSFLPGYDRLAKILVSENRNDKAINLYERYVSLAPREDPNLWFVYGELGKLYVDNGEFNLAEENFQKAILLNNSDETLYIELANLYLKTNKKNKGKEILTKGLRITSGDKIKLKLKAIK